MADRIGCSESIVPPPVSDCAGGEGKGKEMKA